MSVQGTIETDYKQAFKASERAKVSALRMLKSAIKNREIDVGRELTDEETIVVITREVKRRQDACTLYQRAGRAELAAHERNDISVYRRYLPQPLSDEEVRSVVTESVASIGASGKKDFGKVMGAVMAKVKGRADGQQVQSVVKHELGI